MFIDNFMVSLYGAYAKQKTLCRFPGSVIAWSKVNPLANPGRFHETSQRGKRVEKLLYNQKR